MRRSIVLTSKRKKDGHEDVRLFTMNEKQQELFHRGAVQLKLRGHPPAHAEELVERIVINLLSGQSVPENAHGFFHEMRLFFPVLKRQQLRKLPRMGCPPGRITTFLMRLVHVNTGGIRQAMYLMDKDQADWFMDTMGEFVETGFSRDSSWLETVCVATTFLNGAEVVGEDPPLLVLRAAGLFPELTEKQLTDLPTATEDAIRRWAFTTERG